MNNKTPPLYANVCGANYVDKDLTVQNESIYYNTVRTKRMTRPKTIYCNVNHQDGLNSIYCNISELESYGNSQYSLYDNLKPLGLLLIYNFNYLATVFYNVLLN